MPKYLIVYLGGNPPNSPEEGKKHFEAYKNWLKSLGEALISPANPLKNTHTIDPDRQVTPGSRMAMSGYTIIEADSIEEAIKISKSCPFLDIGGTLEISELIEMNI